MAGLDDRRQGKPREFGRAREDDFHQSTGWRSVWACFVLALLLDQLGLDAHLLEARKVFHEHAAHQVIHLVLHADGEQAVRVELAGLAVAVQGAYADFFGAADLVVDAGYGQAALFPFDIAGSGKDFRVDQHAQVGMVFADVNDDNALVHIDLGRRQADAGRGVHGLGHVVDQFADALVYLLHRFGHGVQAGIGIAEDVKLGHEILVLAGAWSRSLRKNIDKC